MTKSTSGLLLLLLIWVMTSCHRPQSVELHYTSLSAMPEGRASAAVGVLGSRAYVLGGRDGQKKTATLFCYDSEADTWTEIQTPEGFAARVGAMVVGTGEHIYLGLGTQNNPYEAYEDAQRLRDWWRYTPATDEWVRLADYPSPYSTFGTPYLSGQQISVVFPCREDPKPEMYTYDIPSNSWSRRELTTRLVVGIGYRAVQINDCLYGGTGFHGRDIRTWWSGRPERNEWNRLTNFPGEARDCAIATTDGRYVYILGGQVFRGEMTGGRLLSNAYRYLVEGGSWERCAKDLPVAMENGIGFCIHGRAYFGLGEDAEGHVLNHIYRIDD